MEAVGKLASAKTRKYKNTRIQFSKASDKNVKRKTVRIINK
jgi:hypothetical protein